MPKAGSGTGPGKGKGAGGASSASGGTAGTATATPTGKPPSAPATATRRKPSPGDKHFKTEKGARREATRSHGASKSEPFKRVDDPNKNPNIRGPRGEPAEKLQTKDLNGKDVSIDHHKHGHYFADDNTYEVPHYHGPNGEHFTYG